VIHQAEMDLTLIEAGELPMETINQRLSRATEHGAYCMGIVTGLAMRHGLRVDDRLLYNASLASGPIGAIVIFRAWAKEKGLAV
jgi:hypothetical protein